MKYVTESKQAVLDHINAINSTTFVLDDVTFGTPSPTLGSWQGNVTSRNTAIRITAKEGSAFQGSVPVVYDRLDLASLAFIKGFKPRKTAPASTHDLIQGIQYFSGIVFSADDIEDTTMLNNGNGTYSGTLTAKAGSVGWVGSLPITVAAGGDRLSDLLTDAALDGLNYPTTSDQEIYAQMYLYPYDFTPYYNVLVDFEEGVALTGQQITDLVTAIKALDVSSGKTLWTSDAGVTQWSLAGAVCAHSGLNGSDLPTNPTYKYVAAINFRDGVTAPVGTLYLHYNDPVDVNAV